MAEGKHGLNSDSKGISLSDQNQPPARQPVTQTTSGSMSGSGTRPNDPKR